MKNSDQELKEFISANVTKELKSMQIDIVSNWDKSNQINSKIDQISLEVIELKNLFSTFIKSLPQLSVTNQLNQTKTPEKSQMPI